MSWISDQAGNDMIDDFGSDVGPVRFGTEALDVDGPGFESRTDVLGILIPIRLKNSTSAKKQHTGS
jgi:hypothetical protein